MPGSQDYVPDPRNADVLIYLNGDLVPRQEARISVFDAGFALGDGVWEGIRLHRGTLLFLDAHLDRLYAGAARIRLDPGLGREEMAAALYRTVDENRMTDGVHLRLMVTRGLKATVNQDPRNAAGRPTIVIAAEYKTPRPDAALALATSSIRCTPASMFDMRLNSHSRLNLITALFDAIDAGADEALMLDPDGYVSSCNATNFFAVIDGEVVTSTGEFCFHGVTRGHVLDLCRRNRIAVAERHFTLEDARNADEAFVTGTFGGVTPVRSLDGPPLRAGVPGPVTVHVAALYAAMKDEEAARGARR